MKIAILGGGFTGLTASLYLAKKGHRVTLIEKESALGGLAVGFKVARWDWYLERAYHHLFANDNDILELAKDIGFNKIFFRSPETASLYSNPELRIVPFDTPADLLKFPYLSLLNKFRAGLILAFLKISPFASFYEEQTAEEFIKKTMGKNVWNILWKELFRKKYGNYAGIILSSFIWARITKRTKKLGYVEGGFQRLIDHVHKKLIESHVNVLTDYEVKRIEKRRGEFLINDQAYDCVISTLPTPVLVKLGKNIFSKNYLNKFTKIKYLHAVTLIVETDKPILKKTYWLNIATDKVPIMIVAQHTNFIDKKYYGNKNIAYIGWYVDSKSKLLSMDEKQISAFVKPYLEKITKYKLKINNSFLFKAPFAQPIFDKEFIKNKPNFLTPVKNFFIANLDMTYPYDRGTNYAVKLGRDITSIVLGADRVSF